MKKSANQNSLLFEIGVEEIPSGYFANAEASIRTKAPDLLAECGWQFDRLDIFTTPRRITVYAENFRFSGAKLEEKIGPGKEQAYQNNQPTQALIGFLKSTGAKESDVTFKDTPKGPRVCVKIKKEFKPLRYFFETLPLKIEFPKLMRWESGRYAFTRPIRWTFAFVGTKEQKYKIADVPSSHFTNGHRFLSKKPIRITSSNLNVYEKLLLKNHVILKTDERIKKIRGFLKHFHDPNEELIQTLAHLTEEPYPIYGTFNPKYLKLPSAVLATCMSKNQKIFACYNASGTLENKFLAVINGKRSDAKKIASNYESVLISRLEDAEFFFREDRKTKLESKVSKLKEMIFLGSLGSYLDKTNRVMTLAFKLAQIAKESYKVDEHQVERAAKLSKADLTTHLVYEFPELQGKAGSEYARLDGEPEAVAKAISGHYLPASLSEDYKELKKHLNIEGALVGIADRFDLLVGASSLGIEFSGSQDPYALRRAAGGIVKILRAYPFSFSLSDFIQRAERNFNQKIKQEALISFIKERIVFELQLKSGSKEYELLQGIFASEFDDISAVYKKFDQLSKEINDPSFIRACKIAERTRNITKGINESRGIQEHLLSDQPEKKLFEVFQKEESKILDLIKAGNFSASVKTYGDKFYEPVHQFFDQVMVNVENQDVRCNRQALVKKINSLCTNQIADLSYIGTK